MSRRWIFITLLSFASASAFVALGFVVPQLLPFTENLIAEAVGLAIAFGLAILAIEGPFLTQQARRRKILARTTESIVAEASEIGMMVSWEICTWLASVIDSAVEFEGEGVGTDWDADIKPLLLQICCEAEALRAEDIVWKEVLSYEDYRSWMDGIKGYSQRIRNRFEANLDVHEQLLELAEAFDRLDVVVGSSMWVTSIRTEVDRINSLGRVGNALVRLMDTIGAVHSRR